MNPTEAAFRGIWERRYFANNGPLVRQLDDELAHHVGTRHAISVVNGFVALMLVSRALAPEGGEMIVPALGAGLTADALSWAGFTPVFCDVDEWGELDAGEVRKCITSATRGVAGVRLPGTSFDIEALETLAAEYEVALLLDARESIGGISVTRPIGAFGDAEVFSLTNLRSIDAAGGACVTTDDDELSLRLRTMRSFHPGESFVPVSVRANGKMSEAQAALGLVGLYQLNDTVAINRERLRFYAEALIGTTGAKLFRGLTSDTSNASTVVLTIDGGRASRLANLLAGAGVGATTLGKPPPGFPNADRLASRLLFVTDDGTTRERVAMICELLSRELS